MLQLLNAHERSESEWTEIISAADSHLELTRILVSNLSGKFSNPIDSSVETSS